MAATRARGWVVPVAVVALAVLSIALPHSTTWQGADNLWLDQVARWRAADQPADSGIVVVAIDEYSARAMSPVAGSWPWPRSVHAELVDALMAAGARAIAFDIFFSEADRYRPEHDAWFGEVIDAHQDVFLPILLLRGGDPALAPRASDLPGSLGLVPLPGADRDARIDLLIPAVGDPGRWQTGTINFSADADGRARRYPQYLEADGWRIPSLPMRIIADLGGTLEDRPGFRIDWRHATRPAYTTHAYADLYGHLLEGEPLDREDFAGKLVIVGVTASGLHDLHATPVDPHYPGVYILANALDNMLHDDRLREAPVALSSLLLFAVLALPLVAWYRGIGLIPVTIAMSGVTVVLLVGSGFAAIRHATLVPVASVTIAAWSAFIGTAILNYWREYQARRKALDTFGRFLDPKVVARIAERGIVEQSQLARDCEVTVLFSDIRGFTTLSETRPAEQVMRLLNDYFTRQVEVIFHHQGTLDKFIGDAIMAFWGAPIADDRHAERAVAAALDMLDAADAFKRASGDDGFDIGIGLHTGAAVVGMLGSALRYDYTAIGDTVNLASRIEGLTKDKARLLVSASTRRACGDAFDFIEVGAFTVKGRVEPVALYEPRRKKT